MINPWAHFIQTLQTIEFLLTLSPHQNASAYYLVRYVLSQLQSGEEKEQANRKTAAAAVLRRLDPRDEADSPPVNGSRRRRTRKEDLVLTQYEQMIAMDVVAPEDIPVAFEGELLSQNS